ncbi:MAG: hypothetical protein PHE58_00720 [Candidatus Omnitrophica bacterium]|nr:hypothetical protein [Candidatus Omnitrophota bacterium]
MMNLITSTPLVLILFSIVGIVIGLFIFCKPELAIEIQRKFYEKINWRMEPISMKKEIRNTKIMGVFLVVVSIATMVCYFLKIK